MSEWQPFSVETEQQLLGAILINNSAFDLVSDKLEPAHFYEGIHQQIYEICGQLIRGGKRATPLTLKAFLPSDHDIGGMTVSQYIARLASEATTVVNAPDFAEIIRDLSDRRVIADIAYRMTPAGAADPLEIASSSIDALDTIVSSRSFVSTKAVKMPEAVAKAIDAAAHAYQNEGKLTGIPYGITELDQKTLGAQRGELVVIAARPSMGKTAIGITMARNMAYAGFSGKFYSLEMGDISLTQRMIADEMFDSGRMTYWQIRSGRFHESVFDRIIEAGKRISELPIDIEQEPSQTVSQIVARARQAKRRGNLDFIIVDHLGLIKPSGRYAGNRVNEIGEITSSLKAAAKELDIVVILLCQLNRGVEQREDKRPSMSDIRMSGDVEQDADTILMLYRESYYLERKEPAPNTTEHLTWSDSMENALNNLDIQVEKQRNGPIGRIVVFCDIGCNAIRDLTETSDYLPNQMGE